MKSCDLQLCKNEKNKKHRQTKPINLLIFSILSMTYPRFAEFAIRQHISWEFVIPFVALRQNFITFVFILIKISGGSGSCKLPIFLSQPNLEIRLNCVSNSRFFSAEFLLSFGCKRLLVERGNSADLDMLFLLFIDSVSPMQFIAFHIDVFVIEKISYKEVVV